MANNLGQLIVKLGIDAGEYTRGLTKAEYQAQKFSKNLNEAIVKVGAALGGLQLGQQFLDATKEIISSAAALNDLADATGSSVENLSKLSNQAKVAGTDFGTLQNLVLKLSAGMAGADDESSKVGQALKFLGVTAKDPVEALQQVAVSLQKYEDGVGKVGLALALFGKQGPAFLATLKDIAELQDVGATVTAKQAAEAENLEKAWRRLSVESEGLKNAVLNTLVPALTDLITQFREGTKVAGGFFAAANLLGQINAGNLPAEIERVSAALEDAKRKAERNKDAFGITLGADAVANFEKQLAYLKALGVARAQASISPANNDQNDRLAGRRPAADFKISGNDSAKKTRETVSEAQRYLENLQKQLEKTEELTVTETALRAIQEGRLKGITPAIEAQVLATARQIDAANELKKAQEEQKKQEQDAARIRERNSQETTRTIEANLREAQTIRDQNETIKENIAFLTGGEAAVRKLTDARLDAAIALKVEEENALKTAGANQSVIDSVNAQIKALQERKSLIADQDVALKVATEAKQLAELESQAYDIAANAIDRMTQRGAKASDVLKALIDDIARFLTQQALIGLKSNLLGGNNAGGDIFSMLAKMFAGSLGGGSTSFVGGIDPVPPTFGSFAVGTPYVPRDMMAMIHRGERVVTAEDNRSGEWGRSGDINISQAFAIHETTSRASQQQIAARAQEAISRAARKR